MPHKIEIDGVPYAPAPTEDIKFPVTEEDGLLREAAPPASKCRWEEDSDGNWETACGEVFVFTDDGPAENKFKHCPYCGLPIDARTFTESDEEAPKSTPRPLDDVVAGAREIVALKMTGSSFTDLSNVDVDGASDVQDIVEALTPLFRTAQAFPVTEAEFYEAMPPEAMGPAEAAIWAYRFIRSRWEGRDA